MSAPPASPDWAVRAPRPGDEAALTALFERVFGRSISGAHWRWKLRRPSCPAENVWLAVEDDRIVFQYAGMPVRVKVDDRVLSAVVSVDTMVAPENQRQRLVTRIAPWVYETWREAGVAFVYGTPNDRWGSMLKKLGFETLFPLEWLVRPLRPEAILARRLHVPAIRHLTPLGKVTRAFWNRGLVRDDSVAVREMTCAGPEFDRLWERVALRFRFCAVRDSDYVSWRFFEPPLFPFRVFLAERNGEPAGSTAFRVANGTDGFLAEIFTAPGDRAVASALLLRVLQEIEAANVEKLYALAAPGQFLHTFLRSAGFLPGRGRWNVVLSPFDPRLPMSDLSHAESWFYSGADTDAI